MSPPSIHLGNVNASQVAQSLSVIVIFICVFSSVLRVYKQVKNQSLAVFLKTASTVRLLSSNEHRDSDTGFEVNVRLLLLFPWLD
jgi:hypothetical protein